MKPDTFSGYVARDQAPAPVRHLGRTRCGMPLTWRSGSPTAPAVGRTPLIAPAGLPQPAPRSSPRLSSARSRKTSVPHRDEMLRLSRSPVSAFHNLRPYRSPLRGAADGGFPAGSACRLEILSNRCHWPLTRALCQRGLTPSIHGSLLGSDTTPDGSVLGGVVRIQHVVGYSFVSSLLGVVLATGTLPVLPVAATPAVTAAASVVGPVKQTAAPGERVELPGRRTATSRTFENANGSRTTVLYPSPVHFEEAGESYTQAGCYRPDNGAEHSDWEVPEPVAYAGKVLVFDPSACDDRDWRCAAEIGMAITPAKIFKAGKVADDAYDAFRVGDDAADTRKLDNVNGLPCNCFVAGTKVQTSDGKKSIESIEIGDRVWAKDLKTGRNELRTVTGLFRKRATEVVTITVASGATVTVTEEHPFFVAGLGWVMSGDLRVGDELAQRDDGSVRITAISIAHADSVVYNFAVGGDHNYYVTDAQLLVHNCAMQKSPGAIASTWGYSTKQIRAAIEKVKQSGAWRGYGANKNPDMLIDDETLDVYPTLPDGTPADDSIGNLFEFLPPPPP